MKQCLEGSYEVEQLEIKIVNKDMLKPKHKNEHEHYEYNKYEVSEKGSSCSVAIYEIPPQKSNYPYHYHMKNEEVFYVISGSGIVETHDGEKEIKAGDIIICPPLENGAHKITNTSQEEKLVYFECDVVSFPDVVCYPHADKIGIITEDKPGRFYKNGDNVAYYEGE